MTVMMTTPTAIASEEEQRVADERQHPDPAVGGAQGAAEDHDERTGHRRADDRGDDDSDRVGSGEGDRSLGDERGSQQPGGLAVLAFGLGEERRTQRGGQGHGERGDHAGGHDGGHDLQLRCIGGGAGSGQPSDGEGVGDLVDRPAEVEAHHRAEDDARG